MADIELIMHKYLNEMATVCSKQDGYAMIIQVHSDDHEPAHCHVLNLDKKLLCKLLITDKCPKEYKDIKYLRPDKFGELDGTFKSRVILWAAEVEDGIKNWNLLKRTWKTLHTKE